MIYRNIKQNDSHYTFNWDMKQRITDKNYLKKDIPADDAIKVFQIVLPQLQDKEYKAEELLVKANGYFPRKDYKKMIELQEQAIKIAPDHVGAHVELAFIYARNGESSKGITMLTNAINRGLNDAKLYYAMGVLYAKKKNHENARKAFRTALNMGLSGDDAEDAALKIKTMPTW